MAVKQNIILNSHNNTIVRSRWNKMKPFITVAYVIGSFPSASETFIVNQLVGMIKRGVNIEIHAVRAERRTPVHPLIKEFGLLDLVQYRPRSPSGKFAIAFAMIWTVMRNIRSIRTMIAAWKAGRDNPNARTFTYLSIAHSLLRSKADIVHAQFGHIGGILADLALIGVIGAPLVVSFRGGDTTIDSPQNSIRYAMLYKTAARLLPVSRFIRDMHVSAGCSSEKLEVLHSGINMDRFPFRGLEYIRGNSEYRMLVVARLTEVKGVCYAISALQILRSKGLPVSLRIAGDGEMKVSLMQLAAQLGILEHVKFLGALRSDMVLEEMRQADVFVAPSIRASDGAEEGMPNAVKEAMAIGVPVVATRTGGIPELVEHQVNGLLIQEKDSHALADAVYWLTTSPCALPSLLLAARSKIENEFDNNKLNDNLIQIYENALITK